MVQSFRVLFDKTRNVLFLLRFYYVLIFTTSNIRTRNVLFLLRFTRIFKFERVL